MHTNRTYDLPYIEGDASCALVNFKIKVGL